MHLNRLRIQASWDVFPMRIRLTPGMFSNCGVGFPQNQHVRNVLHVACLLLAGCEPPAATAWPPSASPADPSAAQLRRIESLERKVAGLPRGMSADDRPVITMYSGTNCPPCRRAKREWENQRYVLVIVEDPQRFPSYVGDSLPVFEWVVRGRIKLLRGWWGPTHFRREHARSLKDAHAPTPERGH